LESEGGSVLESAIVSSIRSICTRSKRRGDGVRGRGEGKQKVVLRIDYYLGFTFVTIFAFIPIPQGLLELVPTGLLFGWYLSLGKKQVMYVKETWQAGYKRKPWKEPLLVASGCLIATLIVFSVAEDLVRGSQ
jgi:hypothetical protein